MAARQCPNCLAIVPPTKISAYSNALVCPACGKPLQISAFSRNLAAFIGLTVGALVWRFFTSYYADQSSALGWVLPIVFAYLAVSVVQSLVLMVSADLRLKDLAEPAAAEAPAAHSAEGGGAGGAHRAHSNH